MSRAIYNAVDLTPENEHILLWAGLERPDDSRFASVEPFHTTAIVDRARAVREAVARLQPDFVHAHSSWAGVYSRLFRVDAPVIYQPHCYKFEDRAESPVKRLFYWVAESALSLRTSAVVVLSPREDRMAKKLNPSVDRAFVPNSPTLEPSGASTSGALYNRVFMIGRISKQKDPHYFLRVAEIVRASEPATSFVWVGDGDIDTRDALIAAGVDVTGWLGADELSALLREGGVYLHSAAYEGFPLSVLDAAAFDVPIVARAIPAFDGAPVIQASSEAEAARLVVALRRGDERVRRDAAAAGIALLESMSREKQSEGLRALYGSRELSEVS
ncbi:glycosyltransferase [Agromyces atrinae]|uniref:glycosyltransferase n=1 Tax=Agromyces atrinae TaxID=592376 RepID=UPI001F568996|nr:glycosyltransferase [Agromyces atrinae]MCI2956082.1 glycosyltransferase [Agromyces atrinae]